MARSKGESLSIDLAAFRVPPSQQTRQMGVKELEKTAEETDRDHPEIVAALWQTGRLLMNDMAKRRLTNDHQGSYASVALPMAKTEEAECGALLEFAQAKGWTVAEDDDTWTFKKGESTLLFELGSGFVKRGEEWLELPDLVIRKNGILYCPTAGLDLLK